MLKGRVGCVPFSFKGAECKIENNVVTFTGPHGTNQVHISDIFALNVDKEKKTAQLLVRDDVGNPEEYKAVYGSISRILAHSAAGVIKPFKDEFKLVGIGFKIDGAKNLFKAGEIVNFKLGFSNSVELYIDDGITLKVISPTHFSTECVNKDKLGQMRQKINKMRKYNPYNGSGIIRVGYEKLYKKKEVKK
jgi:ribosomal protein L6P/L9E